MRFSCIRFNVANSLKKLRDKNVKSLGAEEIATLKNASYYELLGVKKNSSAAEVKKAFSSFASIVHSDVNKKMNCADANEIFILGCKARETLSCEDKKRKYDFTEQQCQRTDSRYSSEGKGSKSYSDSGTRAGQRESNEEEKESSGFETSHSGFPSSDEIIDYIEDIFRRFIFYFFVLCVVRYVYEKPETRGKLEEKLEQKVSKTNDPKKYKNLGVSEHCLKNPADLRQHTLITPLNPF